MSARRILFGAAVAAVLAVPALGQTEAAFRTSGWSGSAHFDAQKRFLYCVVSRKSADGVEYGFRITPQLDMFLGLQKGGWSMQPSQAYEFTVELGSYKKDHKGTVTADRRDVVWINVGNNPDLRRGIAGGGTLNLEGAGNVRFAFSLAGGDNAMRKLLACTALFAVE